MKNGTHFRLWRASNGPKVSATTEDKPKAAASSHKSRSRSRSSSSSTNSNNSNSCTKHNGNMTMLQLLAFVIILMFLISLDSVEIIRLRNRLQLLDWDNVPSLTRDSISACWLDVRPSWPRTSQIVKMTPPNCTPLNVAEVNYPAGPPAHIPTPVVFGVEIYRLLYFNPVVYQFNPVSFFQSQIKEDECWNILLRVLR